MTHEEVIAMVEELGKPFAYDHFAEGEAPGPPFVCFRYPGSDNFGADNVVYAPLRQLDLELYTDRKEPALERTAESVLEDHELFWDKTEVWIPSERLYEVVYTVWV